MSRKLKISTQPAFKPLGSVSDSWGRCDCCKGRFNGARVVLSNGRGFVSYLCLPCALAFEDYQKGKFVIGGVTQ